MSNFPNIFRRAKELEPTLDLYPEAEAHIMVVLYLIEEGLQLVHRGKVKEAIAAFEEAQKRDSRLEIFARHWNTLGWFGSLWGYAADVMFACEKAVELEPENGDFRDTRGLARALTGDINGAIEDFQSFIKWG